MSQETNSVYDAEDRLDRWCRIAQERGHITVFGSPWTPEDEVVFARVEDIQPYCDRVLAHVGHADPVTIRRRRGAKYAHYERRGVIAIPSEKVGGTWAMRERVVLHELAHHLSPGDSHGPTFRRAFIGLLHDIGKPITARLLEVAYAEEGLR